MKPLALLGVVALSLTASAQDAPRPQEPDAGSLVIAGGGGLPKAVSDEFFKLAGGKTAQVVVIPTASADADDPAQKDSFTQRWRDLGAKSVTLLHTRDRTTADTAEFVKPLTAATAVWISGGDQSRVTAAYLRTRVEAELKALLKRGGVVGGTSAGAAVMSDPMITGGRQVATIGRGLGLLPGVVCDQHFVARGRAGRLRGVVAGHPGFVGLGIDEATAAVVTGRTVRVLGDSTVTVVWAAGKDRPALETVLKSGARLDLYQARRAALARAATEPFPPATAATPVVPKGALVIVGGGGMPKPILDKFFELAGGKDASIVVVPTASESEPGPRAGEESLFTRAGATNVTVLHTRDRKTADDPEFSKPLLAAKAVWFGGGRHWRFVDSYEGTLTEERFRGVLERGGVIGGSSAGASIQSEYMPRAHPLGNTVMAAEGYERGFGYLPGVAVDQHFFARNRLDDMRGLMKRYPQLLGIGIDEATAIVVTGSTADVIGKSKVAFFDGTAPMVEVKSGGSYDLKGREPIMK